MKLRYLYNRLLLETVVPEKLYHVSPYLDEILLYGKLKPSGIKGSDDFGSGFGGGITHGISFTSDFEAADDYMNGILLAIMLSKSKNESQANEFFKEWCDIQENRLGVDLSSLKSKFENQLKVELEIRPDSFFDVLKGVRQLITIAASRINKRLDDPVIYGKLEKFSNVKLNNLGIVSVLKTDIPAAAKIESGTDPGEIRISGAEIPIYKVEKRN